MNSISDWTLTCARHRRSSMELQVSMKVRVSFWFADCLAMDYALDTAWKKVGPFCVFIAPCELS